MIFELLQNNANLNLGNFAVIFLNGFVIAPTCSKIRLQQKEVGIFSQLLKILFIKHMTFWLLMLVVLLFLLLVLLVYLIIEIKMFKMQHF